MKPVLRFGSGILAALGIWLGANLQAEPPSATRTQTLVLNPGWNAVFLEVEPADPEPAALFAGTPVEIAAAFTARTGAAQYVSDPNANLFRRAGWGVWYREDRPDAFLKTLHAIHGRQAYLIHSRESFIWKVTGGVEAQSVVWQSDAFNLVGFSVAAGAPTFAQFFGGSGAHRLDRIYRLQNGSWRRVVDASAEAMRAGEAFWIYCEGASTYQGPLRVQTGVGKQVLLSTGHLDLTLRNDSGHPLTATLEHLAGGGDPVPLSVIIQAVDNTASVLHRVAAVKPAGPWQQALPVLEAGEAIRIPLEARREAMSRARHSSLLKITTDLGTETWLPVVAVREDLEEP